MFYPWGNVKNLISAQPPPPKYSETKLKPKESSDFTINGQNNIYS